MLTPVSAISAAGTVQKPPTVTTAPTTIALSGGTVVSAALSQATSNAEARLNILLASVKDRMVQSLLDIMDSLAETVDAPREQDESSAAHALRLADIVQTFTPKQLATVQQQLQSLGQTIPLQVLAQALKDPAGPAGAAMVAYLEASHYDGRDLVTEAVIESYSANDDLREGDNQPKAAQMPTSGTTPAQTLASPAAQAANPSNSASAGSLAAASQAAMAAQVSEQMTDDSASPLAIAAAAVADGDPRVEGEAPDTSPADMVAQAMDAIVEELAPEESGAAPAGLMPELPIVSKEIAADLQEGLKVAIQLAIEVAGPDIADIVANHEAIAETVIADAMVADVLDAAELANPAVTEAGDETAPSALPLSTLAGNPDEADDAVPLAIGLTQILQDTADAAPAAINAALPQQPVQPLIGVPFAVVQYPLAPDGVEDRDASQVDRIDAVDDEAEDDRNRQQHAKGDERQEDAETEAGQPDAAADDSDATGTDPALAADNATMTPRDAAPMPRALPSPGMSMRQEAYGFFQRMAAE